MENKFKEYTKWKNAEIPVVIGVSAHRNIDKRYHEEIKKSVGKFLDEIKSLCPHSPVYMLTGLAQGGDLLCARVAVEKGIKIIAALPFETFDDGTPEGIRYDNERDFDDENDLKYYRELINSEHVIKKIIAPDIENIPPKPNAETQTFIKDSRAYLFRQQAIYVSTNCHILLALWDGSAAGDSRLECGTNIAVEFALKHNYYRPSGMEFFSPYIGAAAGVFSPREGREYGEVKKENFACKYITADGGARPKKRGGDDKCVFDKVNKDDKMSASKKMPRSIKEVLARTDAYNGDYIKYCKALAARKKHDGGAYLVSEEVYNRRKQIQPIHDCRRIATNLSAVNKEKYLRGVRLLSAFGVLLILSWMLYDQLAYRWTAVVCAVMLLALVAGYVAVNFSEATRLVLKIKFRISFNAHSKFIEYRALSEALRVQYYLLALDINENVGNLFAWGHKSEMAWVKMAVTVLLIAEPEQSIMNETELETKARRHAEQKQVITEWIGEVVDTDKGQRVNLNAGQLGYHLRNSGKQRKKIKTRNLINGAILGATFITYALLFASELFGCLNLDKTLLGIFNVRMLLKCCFSLFTAVTFFVSYNYGKLSLDQNVRDSIHMADLFQSAVDRINSIWEIYANDPDNGMFQMKSLFLELARNQLVENGTWIAYNRVNGNDVPI